MSHLERLEHRVWMFLLGPVVNRLIDVAGKVLAVAVAIQAAHRHRRR